MSDRADLLLKKLVKDSVIVFFLFWDLMQEEETKKQPLITEPFHAVISLNKRK